MSKFISLNTLADYLNINENVISEWVRGNKIPYHFVDSFLSFNLDEIDRWIEKSRHSVSNISA